MKAVVIGHLEWVEFVRVARVPGAGEIVHAEEWWAEPAGGGPVAAVQLHRLGADTTFFTALGDDELGHRAVSELTDLGLRTHAVWRAEPTRRAVTHVDSMGERTITVLGNRLAPSASDDLPWDELRAADCVYFTAGDGGALRVAWYAASGTWLRSTDGSPHLLEEGRIAPTTVIVQWTNYVFFVDDYSVMYPEVVGEGDAWIYANGSQVLGTWSKPSADAVTTFKDSSGAPVVLPPGQTWVHLVAPGSSVTTG